MPGAAVAIGDAAAFLLLGANYSDKVTPLSPTLLVCFVVLMNATSWSCSLDQAFLKEE
jgi:hypothetical protein